MNPCRGCEKRQVGCHGGCPDYKAFKEKLETVNTLRRQDSEAYWFVYRHVPSKRNYWLHEKRKDKDD